MSLLNVASQNQPNKSTFSAIDLEKMFLGAVVGGVIDSGEIQKVREEYFANDSAKILFDVCNKIFTENGWVEYVSVFSEFSKRIGTQPAKVYLDEIIASVPSEFSSFRVIAELENYFVKRTASQLLDQAKNAIQTQPDIASEIIYAAYEKIEQLTTSKIDFDLNEEFDETVTNLTSDSPDRCIIRTGLHGFDDVIGGLSTQEITVVGARPGHGKTTLSIGLSYHLLKTNPKLKVVKFELEMSKEAIKRKFLSLESKVSGYKMRLGALTEDEKKKVREAGERFAQFQDRLFIFDNVYALPEMFKILKATKADVCMVDFITLMDGVDDDKRNEIGRIVKYAKRFAKAHNMAWIFFSQLNRGQELRETHRPQMSDLAESDQLTQLASEILLLFYRFKYSFEEADAQKLYLIFDKARYSTVGEKKIYFNPDTCVIGDL